MLSVVLGEKGLWQGWLIVLFSLYDNQLCTLVNMMNELVEHSTSLLFLKKSTHIASTQIENDTFWRVDWSTNAKGEKGIPFNGCQGALSLISVQKQMHPVGQI